MADNAAGLEKQEEQLRGESGNIVTTIPGAPPLEDTAKSRWERSWPTIACGAGLFSDGYLNGVISSVNSIFSKEFPSTYPGSVAKTQASSIVFAGTVVGQLFFGWMSDHVSRKWALLTSTLILILFAILGTASYGAGGSITGLLAAFTAYRFFLGVGIGGEYPAGSVACAESTGELKEGHRNRWFILFTNTQIDFGFVVAAIVPMIVILATTEAHLEAAWRIMLGIGIIPPLSLLYLRIKLQEPEEFKRESIKSVRDTPWLLTIKFYGPRLFIVSLIWFVYDFNSYAFSVYSTTFLELILPSTAPLWQQFGWNTLINMFYIPGAIAGSFISDWIGPKKTLAIFVLVQGLVGFLMLGLYPILSQPGNVAGFVVIYGFFLAFGEVGPGDNIGLIASKTCATAVRGKYYAVAAATGKIGAYVGTQIFPIVINNAPNAIAAGRNPFIIASCLCIFAAGLAFFALPYIGQDTITEEDLAFREYLSKNGYDTRKMGLGDHNRRISVIEEALPDAEKEVTTESA